MHVLIVGGSGLIGSAMIARLAARGDRVLALGRRVPGARLPGVAWHAVDIARMTDPAHWAAYLEGIDAVVNCAGVLQDSPADSTAGVHDRGAASLYLACERAGVRRVVHFSAVGADRPATDFSRTKLAGERALMARELDWVILRPSVVIGRAAYGGSALMRGLAALPVVPVLPDTGPLQLVHLDDVVSVVLHFLDSAAPSRKVFDIVGPRTWSFEEVVRLFRRWMGWRPASVVRLPAFFARSLFRLGDAAALFGWRPPVRSTARIEIARGAVGDPAPLAAAGFRPRDVEAALMAEPASVQERWFARLYVVKPILFVVLPLFWIATGLISLGPGWDIGMGLMREGGVDDPLAALVIIAGALADLAIGVAIGWRPTSRYGLLAAIAISLVYALIGTVLVPRLWRDPLGPMLKIWPIIACHLAALAVLEDR